VPVPEFDEEYEPRPLMRANAMMDVNPTLRLLVFAVFALFGCQRAAQNTGTTIDPSTLRFKTVHARLFANQDIDQEDTSYVLIPARDHELLQKLFQDPVQVDHYNRKIAKEICRLRILDDTDRTTEIMIWWDVSKGVICFSLDGQTALTRTGPYKPVDAFGNHIDESTALAWLVKSLINGNSADAAQYRSLLKKSVGSEQ
jgi:hypothetical protein